MDLNHRRYLVIGTDDETAEAIKTLFDRTPNNSFRDSVMRKKDGGLRPAYRIEVEELDEEEIELLDERAKNILLDRLTALY